MTPEEHHHLQQLEADVKRYRRRIVELKAEIDRLRAELQARDVAAEWEALEPPEEV